MSKSLIPESPCYECQKREPGCHSRCSEYIFFRTKRDEYNKQRSKEKLLNIELETLEYKRSRRKK